MGNALSARSPSAPSFAHAGGSRNAAAGSSCANSDSTSDRSSASPWQTAASAAARSSGRRSSTARSAPSTSAQRSAAIRVLLAELAVEPHARDLPVAADGAGGHAEQPSDVRDREPGEEAQFHDLDHALIDLSQPLQRLVERQQIE